MEVGGDFYEVVALSENSLLMVIADVMGKGLPASLFADSLRTLVRALAKPGVSPSGLLSEINHLMFEDLSSADIFITLQVITAELRERRLKVSNAGHCPLLVSDESGHFRAIAADGMPLGIQMDAIFCEECTRLPIFGSALLYTDGVTEARNSQGQFYGQQRLEDWLNKNATENQTALQLRAGLLEELNTFQEGVRAEDDQTFLILVDEMPREAASVFGSQDLRWSLPWDHPERLVRQFRR